MTLPQTAEDRITQIRKIADLTLYRIQNGHNTEKERTELLRQYDILDRILQRSAAVDSNKNAPIFQLLAHLDREAGIT